MIDDGTNSRPVNRRAARAIRIAITAATVVALGFGVAAYRSGAQAHDRAATARRATARNRATTKVIEARTERTNHVADGPIGQAERIAQGVSAIGEASGSVIERANEAEDLLGQAIDLANRGNTGAATNIYAGDAAAAIQRMQDSLATVRVLLADAQQASATLRAGTP